MLPEIKDKLTAKAAKFAAFLIKNGITRETIYELMQKDQQFMENINLIGKTIGYLEWYQHPLHPEVYCSTEGDVKINGCLIEAKVYKGHKIYKLPKGKETKDVPIDSLVLSCFVPKPEGNWVAAFRDNDPNNCRIQNLYWKKIGR